MRFILTVLTIYLIWQVVKFLFKIAFRYWLKKNAGKTFFYSGGFGSGRSYGYDSRKEGEIRVETTENHKTESGKNPNRNLGEYVDFEEVK
jgi:hypothetical protein